MEKVKNTFGSMLAPLREAPIWLVLLFMLGLRLFFRRPMGFLAAIALGIYWIVANKNRLRWQMQKFRCRLISWIYGYLDKSLWYDNEGRVQILELIERLTLEGRYYCNLADEIDLPPVEHWYAISEGLNQIGIITQCTKNSFYIMWRPAQRASEEAC